MRMNIYIDFNNETLFMDFHVKYCGKNNYRGTFDGLEKLGLNRIAERYV